MINLDSMYPDSEELLDAYNREMAVIKSSMDNLEQLFKRILQNQQFISDKEVAEILHCSVNSIPQKLVRYRPSKVGCYLYKMADVLAFIESKKIGG